MERFLEYWQACRVQEILHALQSEQIKFLVKQISHDTLQSGKITDPFLLSNLGTGLQVVIPQYAKHDDDLFFPYLLLVELDVQGNFSCIAHLSLPIIPYTCTEPSRLCPISLGWPQDFQDYIAINPPSWHEDASLLNWQTQLAYAAQLLNAVNDHWQTDLSTTQYAIQNDVLIFPVQSLLIDEDSLKDIKLDIIRKPKKIRLIDAPRNSGKSAYAARTIIDAWITNGVASLPPPRYVWLGLDRCAKYASIFECMSKDSSLDTPSDLYEHMKALHKDYLHGQAILSNWVEMDARLQEKYADKGGIQARLDQLHASLHEARGHNRHMAVLNAIWVRQKELLANWSRALDFVPAMQKSRLQRLYNFFAQNFPEENVENFSQEKFDEIFFQKVHRAKNNERMVADALHQVENDVHQEKLIRERCLQWCEQHALDSVSVPDIKHYLDKVLWQQLAQSAFMYWQAEFVKNQGYAKFMERDPDSIELLIVEDAQYVSPMQAASLLAKSKQVILMGNYDVLSRPRFAVHIDYELAKFYQLIENDADFEDLQLDGYLGSLGSMWNMLAQQRDSDQSFISDESEIAYELIDVPTRQTAYLGSICNTGVIAKVIEWVNQHQEDDVAIYTTFSAQMHLLQEALNAAKLNIAVYALSEPKLERHEVSIFVPVYSCEDPGPYIFDQGREILDQLVANTKTRIVIIGDKRIFKPELHSASGNFAKAFIKKTTHENKLQEEVDCV